MKKITLLRIAGLAMTLSIFGSCAAPSGTIKTSVGEDSWETLKPSPVQVRLKPFEENKIELAVGDQVVAEGTPTAGTSLPVTLDGQSCRVAILDRYAYTQSDYPASLRRPTSRDRLVEHQYRGLIVQLACADGPVPGTDASHRGTNSRAALPWALPGLIFGILCGLYARSDREGGQNIGATLGFGFLALAAACTLAYRMFDGSYVLSLGLLLIAFGVAGIIGGALWEEGKRYRTIVWVSGAILGAAFVVWKLPLWAPSGPLWALLSAALVAVVAIVVMVASEKDDLEKYRKHKLNADEKSKDEDNKSSFCPSVLWDRNGKIVLGFNRQIRPKGPCHVFIKQWDPAEKVWQKSVEPLAHEVGASRLALTSDNNPVVAFEEKSSLFVKRWNGRAWESYESLGQSLNQDKTAAASLQSLVLNADQRPVVAFCETVEKVKNVFVVAWDGFSWGSFGGSLNRDPKKSAPVCGMVLDAAGAPVVAFAEAAESGASQVFVKKWTGQSWASIGESLNEEKSQNAHTPQIILDQDNNPIVAFVEAMDGVRRLLVKRWNGAAWEMLGTPANQDTNKNIRDFSLARGSLGRPVLFFSQDVDREDPRRGKTLYPDLFVRRWDGLTWEKLGDKLDDFGPENTFSELKIAVSPSDIPAVAYGLRYVTPAYKGQNKIVVAIPEREEGVSSLFWDRITD